MVIIDVVRYKAALLKNSKQISQIEQFRIGKQIFFCTVVFDDLASGAGFHYSRNKSIKSARAEYIERYAFGAVNEKIKCTSWIDLTRAGENAFNPSEFRLYLSDQLKKENHIFRNYREDEKLDWTEFVDFQTSKTILLPLEWSTSRKYLGAPRFLASTTGNAGGSTATEAKLNAILELIERDAFIFYWRTKLPFFEITEWSPKNQIIRDLISGLPKTCSLRFFQMPNDLNTFNVFSVFYDRKKNAKVRFAVAGASRFSIHSALEKSVLELFQSIKYLGAHSKINLAYDSDFNKSIFSFVDHTLLYARSDLANNAFDFFCTNSTKVSFECFKNIEISPRAQLKKLLVSFQKRNLRLFIKNITPVNLTSGIRLKIYRAFSPDLAHMDYVHLCRMLGNSRYKNLAEYLGSESKFYQYSDFNHLPHPFP